MLCIGYVTRFPTSVGTEELGPYLSNGVNQLVCDLLLMEAATNHYPNQGGNMMKQSKQHSVLLLVLFTALCVTAVSAQASLP